MTKNYLFFVSNLKEWKAFRSIFIAINIWLLFLVFDILAFGVSLLFDLEDQLPILESDSLSFCEEDFNLPVEMNDFDVIFAIILSTLKVKLESLTISSDPMQQEGPINPSKKMNTFFKNSIERFKKDCYDNHIIEYFLKMCKIGLFCAIDRTVLGSTDQYIFTLLMIGIMVNFICTWPYVYYRWEYFREVKENLVYFLKLAEENHQVTEVELDWRNGYKWENCVDHNVYRYYEFNGEFFQERDSIQASENPHNISLEIKKIGALKEKERFNTCWTNKFILFMSVALIIYGIITLAISSPSNIEIIFIGLYLIVEIIKHPTVIITLFAIMLLPITLFACAIIAYWVYSENAAAVVQEATAKEVELSGGSCSICLQSLSIGDKFKGLPCNEKHLFHQVCLTTWLKFSKTCPMCRAQCPEQI